MPDSLESAFSAAVTSAAAPSASSDSSSPTPNATPDTTTSTAVETPAPTVETGKVATASAPSSTDPATKRPSGKVAKPQTDPQSPAATPTTPTDNDWLVPEKRARIVDNARAKEREAVTAEIRQYGIDPTDRNAMENIRAFAANPLQYIQQWARHYNIPAEQIYGKPQASAQAQPQPAERRGPSLRAEDGTAAYSAADVDAILEDRMAQIDKSIAEKLSPYEAARQRDETQRIYNQVNDEARQEIADAEANWEGFAEMKPRILELMRSDKRVTMASAYARVTKEYVASDRQKTRQSVLNELKQTPPAPSDVRPGATTRSSQAKSRGMDFTNAVANAVAKQQA